MSLLQRQLQSLEPIPESRSPSKNKNNNENANSNNGTKRRRKSKGLSKDRKPKSTKALYALFNFDTFALDSAMLSPDEAAQTALSNSNSTAVSSLALQEYTNPATRVTLSVVVFSASDMKRLTTAQLPCLGGAEVLYMQKLKDRESGQLWMDISRTQPKHDNKVRSIRMNGASSTAKKRVQWAPSGMVMVVLWSTLRERDGHFVSDIYFHGHGAPVCTPQTKTLSLSLPSLPQLQRVNSKEALETMPRSLVRCAGNEFMADTDNAMKRHRSSRGRDIRDIRRTSSRSKSDGLSLMRRAEAKKERKKKKEKERRKSAPSLTPSPEKRELEWTRSRPEKIETVSEVTSVSRSETKKASKSRKERRVSCSSLSFKSKAKLRSSVSRISTAEMGVCGDDLDVDECFEEGLGLAPSSSLPEFDVAFSSFPAFGSTPSTPTSFPAFGATPSFPARSPRC